MSEPVNAMNLAMSQVSETALVTHSYNGASQSTNSTEDRVISGDSKTEIDTIVAGFKKCVESKDTDNIANALFSILYKHSNSDSSANSGSISIKTMEQCIDLIVEDGDLVEKLFHYPELAKLLITSPAGIVIDELALINNFSISKCTSDVGEKAKRYMENYLKLYPLDDLAMLLCVCLSGKNPYLYDNIRKTRDMWSFEIKREVIKAHKAFFKAFMACIKNHDELLRTIPSDCYTIFNKMLNFDHDFVLTHLKTIREHCKDQPEFLRTFLIRLEDCLIADINTWLEHNKLDNTCPLLFKILECYPEFILNHPDRLMKIEEHFVKRIAAINIDMDSVSRRQYRNSTAAHIKEIDSIKQMQATLEKNAVIKMQKFQTALAATHSLIVPGLPKVDNNLLYRKEMVTTWTPRYYTMEFHAREGNQFHHSWSLHTFSSDSEAQDIKRQLEEAAKIRALGSSALVSRNARRALPLTVSRNILSFLYPRKANSNLLVEFIEKATNTASKHVARKAKAS